IVFKAITIKGVYGREMFETWYKMIAMLQNGLDVSRVITHRFTVQNYAQGFAAMTSGRSGKVILDWT
ncbi:MAG: L-threonine 3-dehydrogenase, partial [Pseudomonadota bacterium]